MAIDADGVEAFKATWNSKPSIHGIEAVVAPPAPYLPLVQGLSQLSLCAQNVSENEQGAHTGEVATPCLLTVVSMCSLTPERRQNRETNAVVAQKARRPGSGLNSVVCVGESSHIRSEGLATSYVRDQVLSSCEDPTEDLVIAYEPVGHWLGRTASADVASEMHLEIKAVLADRYPELRVLYGGSVKPDNCAAFTMATGIDGLLVGGASLSAESFGIYVHRPKELRNGSSR